MKLEEIRKLCDEATPGPWTRDAVGATSVIAPYVYSVAPSKDMRLDALFIAASRTLMPKMLKVAEAAKELLEDDVGMAAANPERLSQALSALEAD